MTCLIIQNFVSLVHGKKDLCMNLILNKNDLKKKIMMVQVCDLFFISLKFNLENH
jgi:hypothetical protein